MGGIFGVASKTSCVLDLFFGIDYHSHLGTRRGGMAVYDEAKGFDRAIHNIENSPFRTKFDRDVSELQGNLGIGCISDNEPQPLLVRSHLGNFAITTVGKINNMEELVEHSFKNGSTHFLEMSGGNVNPTEMVASLINQKANMVEGIRYAQEIDVYKRQVNDSLDKTILRKYWHFQPLGRSFHSFSVQIRTEGDDMSVFCGIGFHAFKYSLCILENSGAFVDHNICVFC